jgi:hypothetical protein
MKQKADRLRRPIPFPQPLPGPRNWRSGASGYFATDGGPLEELAGQSQELFIQFAPLRHQLLRFFDGRPGPIRQAVGT